MLKESQHLPYNETKEGSPEGHTSYRRLTPDALEQLRRHLGKPVDITVVNESWFEGPDVEDHFVSAARVNGILVNVDERTIEVGKATSARKYDSGVNIIFEKNLMKFPFSQEQFNFERPASVSQIRTLTVEGKNYRLDGNSNDAGSREKEDVSAEARTLIEDIMSAEQIGVGDEGSEDNREKRKQRLEKARLEIRQEILRLGGETLPVFFRELEKLEQEARDSFDLSVNRYYAAGQTDPNLGDFYDNEVNASLIGLNKKLGSIRSTREFLKGIEENAKKPTKKYHIGWDNGEEMGACHALTIEVEEGYEPEESAHRFLDGYEGFHILEFIDEVEEGKYYPIF